MKPCDLRHIRLQCRDRRFSLQHGDVIGALDNRLWGDAKPAGQIGRTIDDFARIGGKIEKQPVAIPRHMKPAAAGLEPDRVQSG